MSSRAVIILGATGLVGRECLSLLVRDDFYDRIRVLTRRPVLNFMDDGRVEQHIIDFDRLTENGAMIEADTVICALGTTIKRAGSQEGFRKVDYGYVLGLAEIALLNGAEHFLLVSARGADRLARFFYYRIKGEVESDLARLGYRKVTIFRPSLLLGRRAEFRLGERIAQVLSRFISPLMPAAVRPVSARAVAVSIVQSVRNDQPGVRIVESDEIQRIARSTILQSG